MGPKSFVAVALVSLIGCAPPPRPKGTESKQTERAAAAQTGELVLQQVHTLGPSTSHWALLSVSPDGKLMAVPDEDRIAVWRTDGSGLLGSLSLDGSDAGIPVWNETGTKIFARVKDAGDPHKSLVMGWDLSSGAREMLRMPAVESSSEILTTTNGVLIIRRFKTKQVLFNEHGKEIARSPVLSVNEQGTVYAASNVDRIALCRVSTARCFRTIQHNLPVPPKLVFSRSGEHVLARHGMAGTIWRTATGKAVHTGPMGHKRPVFDGQTVSFRDRPWRPNSEMVLMQKARTWWLVDLTHNVRWYEGQDAQEFVFSPDGDLLVTRSKSSGIVSLHNLRRRTTRELGEHRDASLTWSADSQRLVIAREGLRLFDRWGREIESVATPQRCQLAGDRLYCRAEDQALTVWTLTPKLAKLRTLRAVRRGMEVTLSPDGSQLAVMCRDGTRVASQSDGTVTTALPDMADDIRRKYHAMRWADDSATLMGWVNAATKFLWEREADQLSQDMPPPHVRARWSHDLRHYAAIDTTNDAVQLWDALTGRVVDTVKPDLSAGARITEVAWSPRDHWLVVYAESASSGPQQVHFWQLATKRLVSMMNKGEASFSPDESRVALREWAPEVWMMYAWPSAKLIKPIAVGQQLEMTWEHDGARLAISNSQSAAILGSRAGSTETHELPSGALTAWSPVETALLQHAVTGVLVWRPPFKRPTRIAYPRSATGSVRWAAQGRAVAIETYYGLLLSRTSDQVELQLQAVPSGDGCGLLVLRDGRYDGQAGVETHLRVRVGSDWRAAELHRTTAALAPFRQHGLLRNYLHGR